MQSVTVSLLWCVLQVTLFATAATFVYLVARRVHARVAAATVTGSLLMVLVLTTLAASPWPSWRWNANVDRTATTNNTSAAAQRPAPLPTGEAFVPASSADNSATPSAIGAAWEAFNESLFTPGPVAIDEPSQSVWSVRNVLIGLALACAVFGVARLAWGLSQVRRLLARSQVINEEKLTATCCDLQKRLGLKGGIALRESSNIVTPATVGWRTPTVLLPVAWRQWSEDEVRAVLAHELAHVAGRDYLSWIVARLTVAAHFYHPLVHWLASRLQLEQELAADAMAVALVGDRQQYLHTLASLALATPPHRMTGPARTLIPSRSLLMRRVEMLRNTATSALSPARSKTLRWTCVGTLAVLAIAVAGVRRPATGQEAPTRTVEGVLFSQIDMPERIPLSVVPTNTVYAVSVRPSELIGDAAYQKLVDKINNLPPLKGSSVSVTSITEVMIVVLAESRSQPRFVIRFTTPETCLAFTNYLLSKTDMKKVEVNATVMRDDSEQVTRMDDRTLVIDHYATGEALGRITPPVQNALPKWSDDWTKRNDGQVLAAFSVEALEQSAREELLGMVGMTELAPTLNTIDWTVTSVGLSSKLAIDSVFQCGSETDAQQVAGILQALITLSGPAAEQQQNDAVAQLDRLTRAEQDKFRPLIERMFGIAKDFAANAKPVAEGNRVKLAYSNDTIGMDNASEIAQMIMPSVMAAEAAARRAASTNKIKQLTLAMLNYEATYGHFPAAVNYAEGSEHPHSWRVAILPFLEQQTAYDQYNMNEPWDSETNRKVLAQMPDVMRSPFDDSGSTNTSYFALTGPETALGNEAGTRIAEITDGTSRTLLLVESKQAVPWTKPEDLMYAADKPLPKLGGWQPGFFIAAMCDGSVHLLASDIQEETLRASITKSGGESTNSPSFQPPTDAVPSSRR